YFIALCEAKIPGTEGFDTTLYPKLREIYQSLSEADSQQIKNTEQITNHDVKAVEYFVKEKLDALQLHANKEVVPFGLTSQDIINTAIPYTFKLALTESYYPALGQLITKLQTLADAWKNVPLLAHTHGQPASPTKLGKELMVFVERLQVQLD